MSRNYYSEINLHLVWHTKDSLPLLTPQVEPLAQRFIRQKTASTEGVILHEIGGTETHIHVVVSVPPTLLISEFVGQIKGYSSHEVNHQLPTREARLQWQAGYGVVTFGTGHLKWVQAYVRNQREHHARGWVHDRLERTTEVETVAQAETKGSPVNGAQANYSQTDRGATAAPGMNAGAITANEGR